MPAHTCHPPVPPPESDRDRSTSRFTPISRERVVELRPITPADYEHLQRLEQSDDLLLRGRLGGATLSPDAYVASLHEGVLTQFLVVATVDRRALALVSSYNANLAHGHAHVGVWRLDGARGWDPRALIGMALFVDHLFTRWPFRKLYGECAAYNYAQFASGAGGLFEVEGRLRDHVHLGGRYWDKVILALYRTIWEARRPRVLGLDPRSPEGVTGEGIDGQDAFRPDPRTSTITIHR